MNLISTATVTGTKTSVTESASTVASQTSRKSSLSQLEKSIQLDATTISIAGQLSSLLAQVQDKAAAINKNGVETGLTVSGAAAQAHLTDAQAIPGTYTLKVEQLAQGQELLSGPVGSKSSPLGVGTKTVIQIDVGTAGTAGKTTKLVTIDQSNNTLEGISSALKAAGVQAEIVQGPKGYQLRIDGKSGEANAMHIGVTGDTALKALLSWPTSNQSGMTQLTAAQDAVVSIGGKSVRSPTNTLDGAVAGVSLTLHATGTVKVEIKKDSTLVGTNAKAFIDSVNQLNVQIDSLKENGSAFAKLASQIKNQLSQSLASVDHAGLEAVGISVHGTSLAVDTKKFDAAVAAAPEKVAALLSGGKGGLSSAVADGISKELTSGGVVSTALSNAQKDMAQLTLKKTTLTDSLNRQASLLAQNYSNASQGSYSQFGGAGTYHKMSLFDYI